MPTPTIRIEVDAKRVFKQADGTFALKVQHSDFRGMALPTDLDPDDEVRIEVVLRGDNDVGDAPIALIWPDGHTSRGAASPAKKSTKGFEPKPLLADNLLMTKKPLPDVVPRKLRDRIKSSLLRSRKFVFDTQASERLGEVISDNPELLADYGEFIRLPFPTTWIEFDPHALMKGLGREDNRAEPDDRVGYLYDGNTVYVGASSDNGTEPLFMPYRYRMHMMMSNHDEQEMCRLFSMSRVQIDQFLWGSSFDKLDPTHRRALRHNHTMDFIMPDLPDGVYAPLLNGGGVGDMRNVLAAAMLLLRPSLTSVVSQRGPVKRTTSTLKGPRAFAAHTVVTVKLTPVRLRRQIIAAAKEAARAIRWHEVRAHYCHNDIAKKSSCVRNTIDQNPEKWIDVHLKGTAHPAFVDLMLLSHDWRQEEPDKWTCHDCAGKRWWREYPEGRGDAGVGVVTKYYEVKP